MDTLILGTHYTGRYITLSTSDRRRHVHVVGRTGSGKSTLLLNLMLQDLAAGRGFALLDPHGDLAQQVANAVPRERTNDVLYLDPADYDFPFAFNPLANVLPHQRATAAAHVVSAFKHIWADSWGYRMEYVLLNTLRLLLDTPGTTLLGILRTLADEEYRERLLTKCHDPVVREFWTRVLPSWSDNFTAEVLSPIYNKVGALLMHPMLRNVVSQPKPTVRLRRHMDARRVIIANLSKAVLGEEPAHLLGALLATGFAQAAQSRADTPEEKRVDFTLYADEFQNFATNSFASILSEARKWRLSLVLAHQYFDQLPPALRHAVLGNAGSLVAFRLGAADAKLAAAEFDFGSGQPLTDLANFTAWVKLLQDNEPDMPREMRTLRPVVSVHGRLPRIMARTRARYTRPRSLVEAKIARYTGTYGTS